MTPSIKNASKYLAIMFAFALAGCGSPTASETRHLAVEPSVKNIALVFSLTYSDVPASYSIPILFPDENDGKRMSAILEAAPYNFEVRWIKEANRATVLAETARAISDLPEHGSLVWYFSGHGTRRVFTNPILSLQFNFATIPPPTLPFAPDASPDEYFLPWKDVKSEMVKSLGDKRLARLILINDSCYSGEIVNGDDAFVTDSGDLQANGFYDQALVFSASARTQKSRVLADGSLFTTSLSQAFSTLTTVPTATIGNLVETTMSQAKKLQEENFPGVSQTPQFRAFPSDAVLADKLNE